MYNYDFYQNYLNKQRNINQYYNNNVYRHETNPNNLTTPKDGFIKGNAFSDLYIGYKDYKPYQLTASNEKDNLYLELSSIWFMMHDVNLYLDIYPDDKSMLRLFNDYRNSYNKLLNKYEELYGPLTITSDAFEGANNFIWEEQSWPWEGKNV